MISSIGTIEVIKPPKEVTLEGLHNYLAKCSSVVRDANPKNPSRLFDRLLKESYGGRPSRVLEYIPCKIGKTNVIDDAVQYFGFFTSGYYYTNMRELLNWGWSIEECLDVVDFTDYITLRCVTPYFIYGHVSTHNQLTTVAHSQRYADCKRGYWVPQEYITYKQPRGDYSMAELQEMWDSCVMSMSPKNLSSFMRKLGVKGKEVYNRGSDMLQYRPFTIGMYKNNPNAYKHFINQRRDVGTQKETVIFTNMLVEFVK